MSKMQRFYNSQKIHSQLNETQSTQLRQTLIQRAKKLKQKMYQETNYYDYSIDNLMNQTLKQIKKHKEQFKEKQQYLPPDQQSEQTKTKKLLLKSQLIQNLQKCKNRYKKHITAIKNQKSRVYTEVNQLTRTDKHNFQEMLITAKDRFKKEQREKRNYSQIINLGSLNRQQLLKSHNRTQNILGLKNNANLYQNLMRANQDLTHKLQDHESYPRLDQNQIREQTNYRANLLQILGNLSPTASKKQIFSNNNKTTKKVYYSPYRRFPIQDPQSVNNQIQNLTSQRSVFIPIGKVTRLQRKALEVSNTKREKKHVNNKLSTQIVDELVQRQHNDERNKFIEKDLEQALSSSQPLAKNSNRVKSISKTPYVIKPSFLSKSSIFQSQKNNKLKEQKVRTEQILFENIKGTRIATEYIPILDPLLQIEQKHEKQQKILKIGEQIKNDTSLNESQVFDRLRKDSLSIKSSLYNKKYVSNQNKQLSRRIHLDVRGNHLNLINSIKLQGSHKYKDSQMSIMQ